MTLGEQFKQRRLSQGLSQPELAELAGIEQSYLSKLENDKSLPSNDILRKLLNAFNLSIAELLAPLTSSYIEDNLLAIADIEQHQNKISEHSTAQQRKLLYIACSLIVLAVTLFYTGFSKQLFNETVYEYHSRGVVLEGEPLNVFTHWHSLIDRSDRNKADALKTLKSDEMAQRSDLSVMLSHEDKGQFFDVNVEGGKRMYKRASFADAPRAINAWLQILGVLFITAGVMCFVLERRLFKQI